uniref:Uncharacterized protein n=1 Tax=Arundo donax TaxID=35708 RepID=A0A0A9CR42_ARUDO
MVRKKSFHQTLEVALYIAFPLRKNHLVFITKTFLCTVWHTHMYLY